MITMLMIFEKRYFFLGDKAMSGLGYTIWTIMVPSNTALFGARDRRWSCGPEIVPSDLPERPEARSVRRDTFRKGQRQTFISKFQTGKHAAWYNPVRLLWDLQQIYCPVDFAVLRSKPDELQMLSMLNGLYIGQICLQLISTLGHVWDYIDDFLSNQTTAQENAMFENMLSI